MTQYLALLFPDAPDDAWLVVSWLQGPNDFRSQWFMMAQQADAIAWLLRVSPLYNTYIGLGLRHPQCQPSSTSRGTSAEVCAIGGLWVELDHTAGVHSATNLPTPDELTTFLHTMPFEWSLLVDSGGGIHAYLLFRELWYLTSQEEYARAALLLRRFQRGIQAQASNHGWKVDSTADLARVLRPAGTINHKATMPLPVHIAQETDARYNPLAIETAPWLPIIEDTYTPPLEGLTFPATDLERITAGCAWLAHCQTDAAILPEPEWYAMLGIVGRCADGVAASHDWSSTYPRYDVGETTKKLEHALAAAGPRTCSAIRYDLGGEPYCQQCPNWQKVKSPIVLGMAAKATLEVNGHAKDSAAASTILWTTGLGRDPETHAAWYLEAVQPFIANSKRGIVDANNTTIMAFLENHSYWQDKLWWNAMSNRPMFEEQEINDNVVTELGAIFGKKHTLPIRTNNILMRCLAAVCWKQQRDPLQDWLRSLGGWDGVLRLDTWLEECTGVASTALHQWLSRILPVSMVARAFDPGCLYRNVIVFEGPEEYRKSSLVAALVPFKQWHLSMVSSFGDKDVPMLIQGIWIAELSELDSLSRTEGTRLKSFISDTEDSYVPKWQLFRTSPKRRTIFIGTTNESTWIKDPTGNTRFWPIRILHPMDVEYFVSIREQLLAEAMVWYTDHLKTWWDIPYEVQTQAKEAREERRQASIYESDLALWLHTGRFTAAQLPGSTLTPINGETTWLEIATGFLRLDTPEKWKDQNLQKQVGHALKALGWEQKVVKRGGKSLRVWREEPPPPF